MNSVVSLAMLAGGIVLLVFGIVGMNSAGSDISRFFTGAPTDKSVWMFTGGIVLTLIGLGQAWRGRSAR